MCLSHKKKQFYSPKDISILLITINFCVALCRVITINNCDYSSPWFFEGSPCTSHIHIHPRTIIYV